MKEIFSVLFNLKNEKNMRYIEEYNVYNVQIISILIFTAEAFFIYLNITDAKFTYFMEWFVILLLTFILAIVICVSIPLIISTVLWGIDKLFLKMNGDVKKYFRIAVLKMCIEPVISQLLVIIIALFIKKTIITDVIQLVMWGYSIVFVVYYVKLMYKSFKAGKSEEAL